MVYQTKEGQARGHVRIYKTRQGRKSAITQLRKQGFNYFTTYLDVQGFGVSIAAIPESIMPVRVAQLPNLVGNSGYDLMC